MSTIITQNLEDFLQCDGGKSLETKIRESKTKLHRKRISEKDKVVPIKRLRNSKYKSYKKELRYFHRELIVVIDEAWNILDSKQKMHAISKE